MTQTKYLLILLGILITALLWQYASSPANLGGGETLSASLTRVERKVIKEAYFLSYQKISTGDIEDFEVSQEEYEDVINNNKQPGKEGYIFYGGYGKSPVYDSVLPTLKDNEYVITDFGKKPEDMKIMVKIPDKSATVIDAKLLQDNKINVGLIK